MKRAISIIIAALVIVCAALIVFTPLSPQASAQSAAQKQLYNVSINRFKPELETEYYDFVKNVMNPLYVKGGINARYAYRPDRGTRNEIIYFVPMESYATIGVPPDGIGRALGNEEATRLFWQRHSRFLESAEILTVEAMPDLSWTHPKFQGQPQLALMRWQTVAYGRSTEYEDFFKNLEIPARRKTAEQSNMLGQWRFRLRFGGDVYRYLMLRPMASYAEQDAGGTKGLGQILGAAEYQKLLDKLPKGVILQDEAYLIRYRPDLSITPQTSTAEKK
ncbi:MAG TPA: hypothetical protein VFZ34_07130 [Blastocatellia bacterium]|nr:hypothetical protein [Blastocatellia bacterium]